MLLFLVLFVLFTSFVFKYREALFHSKLSCHSQVGVGHCHTGSAALSWVTALQQGLAGKRPGIEHSSQELGFNSYVFS